MGHLEKCLQLKRELDTLRPFAKDDEARVLQKLRLDWNYHSNHLEGNSLSHGETKALILEGLTAHGKPLKDHLEIKGHNDAVKWTTTVVKEERPLTENFIRELHRLILIESYDVPAQNALGNITPKAVEIGSYKTTPNHVITSSGEIFHFASPEETPAMMNDLMQWYKNVKADIKTEGILLATQFHYKYVRIHPFDDGNGRTARLLMNFILMQYGYPPAIIKTEDRKEYFSVLRQADADILTPFVEFVAQNLSRSLKLMILGAKGKNINQDDDIEKEIILLKHRVEEASRFYIPPDNSARIRSLLKHTISVLYSRLISQVKEFSDMYGNHTSQWHVGGSEGAKKYDGKESLDITAITKSTTNIQIRLSYTQFSYPEFEPYEYNSRIEFWFQKNQYVVRFNQVNEFYKSYDEALTSDEIDHIIKLEFNRHKNVIESRIEDRSDRP